MRRFQEAAFRTAYLVTGNASEAEDAAQEAFVKAYYALARVRPGAPFRPWLLRIVANEASNRRRASRRRASLALRAGDESGAEGAAQSPETLSIAHERRAVVLHALGELRDDDRRIIAYRYFLDLSEAEIAEALACARGTVKSRLSRALGRLRDRLTTAASRSSPGDGTPESRKGAAHG